LNRLHLNFKLILKERFLLLRNCARNPFFLSAGLPCHHNKLNEMSLAAVLGVAAAAATVVAAATSCAPGSSAASHDKIHRHTRPCLQAYHVLTRHPRCGKLRRRILCCQPNQSIKQSHLRQRALHKRSSFRMSSPDVCPEPVLAK
jgi:hypothetical protein